MVASRSGPLDAFRQGLRDRGYVEGRNVRIERLPELARELVAFHVDVIFAINTQAARAAHTASKTIPIVIARVADPVRSAYGPSIPEMYRRAAHFVDAILKGAKPGELPVEQPTTFHLVINMKTARALGIMIPPSLMLKADEVVQ